MIAIANYKLRFISFALLFCLCVFFIPAEMNYARAQDLSAQDLSTKDPPSPEDSWNLKINKNGIKIYNREVHGSRIKEFKGTCIVNASIFVVSAVMLDFNAYPSWIRSCKGVRKIECMDDINCILHYAMDLPIPLSNRDAILKASTTVMIDDDMIIVDTASASDYKFPLEKGVIRIQSMYIKMVLRRISDNQTSVTLLSWADPSGYIPGFIVNWAAKSVPYETMLGIMEMVKRPKYLEEAKGINKGNVYRLIENSHSGR